MTEPFSQPDAPLCVVVLTYVAPIAAIDHAMAAHVAWLTQGYEQGVFLVSGRRTPRTGGVIVVRGEPAAVEAVVATDPFVVQGLATAEVIAMTASMAAPALADLLA